MSTNDDKTEIEVTCYEKTIESFKDKSAGVFDMNSWLMRRNTEYAEIRDVRGASVLLSQSIIQFLVPEKGVKIDASNEMIGGISHSKCNKDIRIGVTLACKEFGMKITGRGSIAGCESSNLIDIPIICDVLQSVGLFEDSSFPNPSDKVDKAERAERKAAKKAAQLGPSNTIPSGIASTVGGIESESSSSSTLNLPTSVTPAASLESTGIAVSHAVKSSLSSSEVKQKQAADSVESTSNSAVSNLPPLPPPSLSSSHSLSSLSTMEENNNIDDHKYCPNLIDIEAVLTNRWSHQLQDYLNDMHTRKTPYQYHAADGISSEGVAMVASYLPTSASTPRNASRTFSKFKSTVRVTEDCVSIPEENSGDAMSSGSGSRTLMRGGLSVVTDSENNDSDELGSTATRSPSTKKRQRTSYAVATVTAAATGTLTSAINQSISELMPTTAFSSKSIKKNKAIKATKVMIDLVLPFEVSATPRQTPQSVTASASGASRRLLDKFRGTGEQLDMLESGDVKLSPVVTVKEESNKLREHKDGSSTSADTNGSDSGSDGTPVVMLKVEVDEGQADCAKSEVDDTCVNNSNSNVSISCSSSSNINAAANGKDKYISNIIESDMEKKERAKLRKKEKEKERKARKLKLKYLEHEGTGDDLVPSSTTSSSFLINKKSKRKDLLVVISPATGGPVASGPVLPPRIGSGGVGGTTTGYTIAPALLKPSIKLVQNATGEEKGAIESCTEQLTGAQAMFLNPSRALQSWSHACYEEGLVLAEEERLLRYIAGMCELSLPAPAFRVGTTYLDPTYSYTNEQERLSELTHVVEEGEEREFGASLVSGNGEDSRSSSKRRRMGNSGSGRRRKDRSWSSEADTSRSRGGGGGRGSRSDCGISTSAKDDVHMMHSAVSLDCPDGSNTAYFDQFEGDECEKVTNANVSLTASMLWLRAQANAIHKPAASASSQNTNVDTKQRPKREKKDFFETFISETGGQAIASVATTTLAAVAGTKQSQHTDEDMSRVVLEQIEKIKKGNRNSAVNITTLHPGALEALEQHGVSSVASLPLGHPGGGGGVKRQRSLSNAQLSLLSSSSSSDAVRSSYFADTIGGYPTKNTVPPMHIHPSLFATVPPSNSYKSLAPSIPPPSIDNSISESIIHTCPYTNRISLPDLTIYSVKMPWKLLAREFEVFDPSAMEKEHTSYPRTPTSMPSSPRFPLPSASSSTSAGGRGTPRDGKSTSGPEIATVDTTSNLNGPMGVWVSTAPVPGPDKDGKPIPTVSGLRITAPPISTGPPIRRRRKRNSDGVLMEIDRSITDASPRPSLSKTNSSSTSTQSGVSVSNNSNGPREFRRLAFADVLAPSFRLVEKGEDQEEEEEEEEEEEDISDEAILKRHEATLSSMRERYQAIQELKKSLKKSANGDDDYGSGQSGGHPTSNISHAHNKRKKGGARPPTPKTGVKKHSTTSSGTLSPKTPKGYAYVLDKSEKKTSKTVSTASKVVTRHSKCPANGIKSESIAPLQRKRGRPMKLNDA